MMNICIVEDDDRTARTIEAYVKKFFAGVGEETDVKRYGDARDFLKEYQTVTDLVFMDIELPVLNGMDAVHELRKKDEDVMVIFVTNLAQYAVNGYEVRAFDFIVKPISYGNFAMKLRRASQIMSTRRKREICVSTRQGKTLIKASDIKYVEIMRHMITFHTVHGETTGSGTLKGIMENLSGLPFALCNRCYLVNLQYVTKILGNEVCVGKEYLQISAPRKKEFLNRFNEFLGAGGNLK